MHYKEENSNVAAQPLLFTQPEKIRIDILRENKYNENKSISN